MQRQFVLELVIFVLGEAMAINAIVTVNDMRFSVVMVAVMVLLSYLFYVSTYDKEELWINSSV